MITRNFTTKPKKPNTYTKRQLVRLLDQLQLTLMSNYEYENIRNSAYHELNSLANDMRTHIHKIK